MPFFINENFGYFCIADEYKQYQNVNYMPWKLVSGNLENYEEVEFPHEPRSPFHVHCSPIFVNDFTIFGLKIFISIVDIRPTLLFFSTTFNGNGNKV